MNMENAAPAPVPQDPATTCPAGEEEQAPEVVRAATAAPAAPAPAEADTGAGLDTPRRDKEVDAPLSTSQKQEPSPAPVFCNPNRRPDCAFAAQSLVEVMPFQKVMRRTFAAVRAHGFPLPSEIEEKDYHGQVLFAGTQSAGKTSVVTRILGKDILPSGPNLSTRRVCDA